MTNSIISIKNLTIGQNVDLVHGISFSIPEGSTLALVGESGSGKSLTAQAILGLFSSPLIAIKSGSILYQDEELIDNVDKLRGIEIGYIPQNPLNALNPTLTIGFQLKECVRGRYAKKRALEMLHLVGIADPQARMKAYPHELSGGMRQRVLIAMSLINNPKFLIADEPTTALDSTIQAQIIDLLKELKERLKMSLLFITHDLGLVAQIADHIAVMHEGHIVEYGTASDIFYRPEHSYTKTLLSTILKIEPHEPSL